jgi:hypothetical protein
LTGYELVSADSDLFPAVSNGLFVQGTVHCPTDKRPLGGGWEPLIPGAPPSPGAGNVVFLNLTSSTPTADGWMVTLRNGSGSSRSNVQFRVWAVCVSQP